MNSSGNWRTVDSSSLLRRHMIWLVPIILQYFVLRCNNWCCLQYAGSWCAVGVLRDPLAGGPVRVDAASCRSVVRLRRTIRWQCRSIIKSSSLARLVFLRSNSLIIFPFISLSIYFSHCLVMLVDVSWINNKFRLQAFGEMQQWVWWRTSGTESRLLHMISVRPSSWDNGFQRLFSAGTSFVFWEHFLDWLTLSLLTL